MKSAVTIREDMRRDGLCMNFLLGADEMLLLSKSIPNSVINVGYPGVCEAEERVCGQVVEALSSQPIESAIVGHAIKSHIDVISKLANPYNNTSGNFWIPFSDHLLSQTIKKNEMELLSHTKSMVKYWRSKSDRPLDVAFADSTAPEPQLKERLSMFYEELMPLGVRNIILCDTKGQTTPGKLVDLISSLPSTENIEYHPHDDNGLGPRNIEAAVYSGISRIGTSFFKAGERGSMIDPRDLVESYGVEFDKPSFDIFQREYLKLMESLGETEKIFSNNVVVTGTQLRLYSRDSKLTQTFGYTSDSYMLAEKLGIEESDIPTGFLGHLKNSFHQKRKRSYSEKELSLELKRYSEK